MVMGDYKKAYVKLLEAYNSAKEYIIVNVDTLNYRRELAMCNIIWEIQVKHMRYAEGL